MSRRAPTDPFAVIVGAGRGGGAKAATPDTLPATGLARFSVHPGSGLHLDGSSNAAGADISAAVSEHAQKVQAEATLLAAAAAAAWHLRAVTNGSNSPWVAASKLFANVQAAGEELQSLGAIDIHLEFFPSGSVKEREGYRHLDVTPERLHFFPSKQQASNRAQSGRRPWAPAK